MLAFLRKRLSGILLVPYFQTRLPKLQDDLFIARIHVQAEEYLVEKFTVFFVLLLVLFVVSAVLAFVLNPMFLLLILIAPAYFIYYLVLPGRKAVARLKKIDRHMGEALRYLANLSVMNLTLKDMLKKLCEEKQYGIVSDEACELVYLSEIRSTDIFKVIEEYLKMVSQKTQWGMFLQGLINIRKSGGIERDYILRNYEDYRKKLNIEYSKLSEILSMYAELFITITVSFPLFLILIFAIMGIISNPAVAQASLFFIFAVTVIMIPVSAVILAWLSRSAQEGY